MSNQIIFSCVLTRNKLGSLVQIFKPSLSIIKQATLFTFPSVSGPQTCAPFHKGTRLRRRTLITNAPPILLTYLQKKMNEQGEGKKLKELHPYCIHVLPNVAVPFRVYISMCTVLMNILLSIRQRNKMYILCLALPYYTHGGPKLGIYIYIYIIV